MTIVTNESAIRTKTFLKMILDSINGGGNVVTFQDIDIEELEELIELFEADLLEDSTLI